MAQISNIRTKDCLVWETETPELNGSRKSSTFLLLGYQWNFHLGLDNLGYYYITAHKAIQNELPLKQNVTVKTFIRDEASGNCMSNNAQTFRAGGDIWSVTITSVNNALGSNFPHRKWTITFVFHSDCPLMLQMSTSEQDLSEDKCVQTSLDIPPDLESLSSDFCQLLESETFTDVKLRCGDRTISAHRSILAARSHVFTAMFQNKMAESETGTVDVPDVDSDVLDLLIKYVYSGKVLDLSHDTASSLYEAGDKYSIHALTKSCSDWMVGNLTAENCLGYLVVADAHSDEEFKGRVVDFVAENLKSIKKDAWSKFNKDHVWLACSVYQKRLAPTLDEQA